MSQKGFSSGQGYRPEQVVMLQLMQNDTSEGAADSVKPHYSNALKGRGNAVNRYMRIRPLHYAIVACER